MSYLETLVTRFYEKHDPSKLGDVSHVTGIVSWTKNNGMEALEAKLKGKYKENLATLTLAGDPPVDSDWQNVRKALDKFYLKHEPNKNEEQIQEIYSWTIQKGVFALNERLMKKFGEALPKKALESWKSRWAPVEEENKSVNYEELLIAFFSIHDPNKSKADIQFLANYAIRHGLDPVNEQLRVNFGVGLEDVEHQVTVVAGPSSLKTALHQVKIPPADPRASLARRGELAAQLTRFYQKYDASKLQNVDGAFDKIVDYGMNKGLRKLNAALRDKYNDDLDTMRRETIRQSIRDFASTQGVSAIVDEEAEVSFAMDNGVHFLDVKLTTEYDVLELNACIAFLRTGREVPRSEFDSVLHDMTHTFTDSRDDHLTALFAQSPPDGSTASTSAWTATAQEIKLDAARRQKDREMEILRASNAALLQQKTVVSPQPVPSSAAAIAAPAREIKFERRPVLPPASSSQAKQSALTRELLRARQGGGVVTGAQDDGRNGGTTASAVATPLNSKNMPSVKLTIFLPDRTPFEIRVSKRATVTDAIAAVLERTLIAGKKRRNVKAFEMRMHDEDGMPDEDFPALDASQSIAEIGASEFCLVELLPMSAAEEEMAEATASVKPANLTPSSQQRKQSLSKAGVIHVQFVDIEHHDQRGSSQKVEDARASQFLKKVVKAVQLPLIADEYQFHVTEQDRERLQMVSSVVNPNDDVLALGVEVLLLRKRRYADAPPDVEAVLGAAPVPAIAAAAAAAAAALAPQPQAAAHDVTPPPQHKMSALPPLLKSSTVGLALASKKSTNVGLVNNNTTTTSTTTAAASTPLLVKGSFAGVDPNTILLNEIKAAVYEEWKVVKTNNWGKRQARILGIDLTKIYNKPQHAGSGRVKNAERLIADVYSIELNPNNAAAFTIKVRDTGISGGLVTLNYEAEEGGADDAARIVAKVKYIMGGRGGAGGAGNGGGGGQ